MDIIVSSSYHVSFDREMFLNKAMEDFRRKYALSYLSLPSSQKVNSENL